MPAVDAKDSSSEIDSELAGSDKTMAMMHNPREFNEEERRELTTDAIPTMLIIADLTADIGKAERARYAMMTDDNRKTTSLR